MIQYLVEYSNMAEAWNPIYYRAAGVWVGLEEGTIKAYFIERTPHARRSTAAEWTKNANEQGSEGFLDYLQKSTSMYVADFGEVMTTAEPLPVLIKRLQLEHDFILSEVI
jgi:hypothetical protein